MALSECDVETRSPESGAAIGRNERSGFSVVEELIDQLSDVIYGLASHRPEPSDGIGWVSFDAAICGLHSALVALEDFGGLHSLDRLADCAVGS